MLRKVRCRLRPRRMHDHFPQLPLPLVVPEQQTLARFLNESQNCAAALHYEYPFSITRRKRYPSLIAIDIDSDEFAEERLSIKQRNTLTNFHSSNKKWPLDGDLRAHRKRSDRSLIKLTISNSSVELPSCRYDQRRNADQWGFPLFHRTIRKRNSDSIPVTHPHHSTSKQRFSSHYPSHNSNTVTSDSPISSTSASDSLSSVSEISTPSSQKGDKTWRLKIQDDLNKDGSRHFVVHKGSEESIRERRQSKRAKQSEEKKRRIQERLNTANQRWQKYSSIDYELVFFISRYYDQLPLCSDCRRYFTTHQTHFLSEDPRASLDYAADAALQSSNGKNITLKQAAKSRLIKDYDKQTNIIFNLCDACLTKCETIRNELKQISVAQKMSSELRSPNINLSTPDLQPQSMLSPFSSPKIFNVNEDLYSPISSPSPRNTDLPKISSVPTQNTITDLNQLYVSNLIQCHQIRLQQLYEQSQSMIIAQQNPALINDQQRLYSELQSCIKQMQYHCLEILHLQNPGYSFSFPYTPAYHLPCLTYRHLEADDSESTSSSSSSEEKNDDENPTKIDTEDESDCSVGCYPVDCDRNSQSIDDRLTIETCHGLVEYCNAPLDDFIRGLQVLKCLSTFNRFPS